ncbi:MAG TPA: Veg family protein [Bacillota bacterium]|nr:Veg family protein [Bacillota bacterium]
MIEKSDLKVCRSGLEERIGRKIWLKSKGGRKRTIIHEGYLDTCSSNVFTVRCPVTSAYDEYVSFSYVDVLTKVVEIRFDKEMDSMECAPETLPPV